MNTATGVLVILAIFTVGVAVLAILFFGKSKTGKFSRFADKSGGRGDQLVALVVGLLGIGLLVLSLMGVDWGGTLMAIGALLYTIGFRQLLPGMSAANPRARVFLIRAWIDLALALACFGGAIALYSQGGGAYGRVFFGIPALFLVMFGCVAAGIALADYLRYVGRKPLPKVEPPPAVLAALLKPPGAPGAAQPPVAAPPIPVEVETPAASPLPGLFAGVVCLSAGIWFRATELVSTEVGYVVGVPLFVYGVIRCGLSLIALARSLSARRI
ncbi:hypothetical protein ACFPOE_19740 [Caenimonas terrae]|uniref:Uncharacterized protein n=1 Tax=Caenimonas terrae TaxID=696074 RepID=A0ABW0NHB7_9BURK